MHQPLQLIVLGIVAFVAAMLAAVTGFGGAAVLLPMLVLVFGVREAIPILTVAQLIGNGSRVWFNRRELDWKVVAWFALGRHTNGYFGRNVVCPRASGSTHAFIGCFLDPDRGLATCETLGPPGSRPSNHSRSSEPDRVSCPLCLAV